MTDSQIGVPTPPSGGRGTGHDTSSAISVPYWVILAPVSAGAKTVYAVLVMHIDTTDPANRACSPSRERLADILGFNRPQSVDPYLQELEAAGIISIRRGRNPRDPMRNRNAYVVRLAGDPAPLSVTSPVSAPDAPPRSAAFGSESCSVGPLVLRLGSGRRERSAVRTALYWHYDGNDLLLYIGTTKNPIVRGENHAAKSSWAEFAVRADVRWYPSRVEAEAAERDAIRAEHPLFNHTHNKTPEARARLVAYLLDKGRTDLLAPAVSRG